MGLFSKKVDYDELYRKLSTEKMTSEELSEGDYTQIGEKSAPPAPAVPEEKSEMRELAEMFSERMR